MVELQEELTPANDARLREERAKLEQLFDYKRTAAQLKFDHDTRVLESVSRSHDSDVLRIVPVWAKRVERARRDIEMLAGDRERLLQQLDSGSSLSAGTTLLSASYVVVEPDPKPLIAQVRSLLPNTLGREFARLCGRPTTDDLETICDEVRIRRAKLKALAANHKFDSKRAQSVGQVLERLLDPANERSGPERTVVHAAARYYLHVGDQQHDLHSADGFADDEKIVVGVREVLSGASPPA
jgi:hypothetical protein